MFLIRSMNRRSVGFGFNTGSQYSILIPSEAIYPLLGAVGVSGTSEFEVMREFISACNLRGMGGSTLLEVIAPAVKKVVDTSIFEKRGGRRALPWGAGPDYLRKMAQTVWVPIALGLAETWDDVAFCMKTFEAEDAHQVTSFCREMLSSGSLL